MLKWLQPQDRIDEREVHDGLRMLVYDGVCSQAMGTLTGGAVLVAFAVLLGASNLVIGLLAAVGPLTQILQIPAVFLVDRTGLRKGLVVLSSFLSRLSWLAAASIPWLVPEGQRVAVLLVCLLLYFGLGTLSGCAYNSWMRDFVPEQIRGSYSGKRMAIATAVGAAVTLVIGLVITGGKSWFSNHLTIYAILFVVGGAFGLVGVYFLARIPEPKMARNASSGLLAVLWEPLRESNYRQLLIFLGIWNFAINLAAPFFTVYMLQRLGMPMAIVLPLSVLSQVFNVLFFRVWGRLADRFSDKSVLMVSGSLFIISIVLWPFLTMPEGHVLTLPLLAVIHVLAGVSTAGVTICSANIALKTAPYGKATAYLASNAFVSGMAATAAPILAGIAADWFSTKQLSLTTPDLGRKSR
jgi:MFS family permease